MEKEREEEMVKKEEEEMMKKEEEEEGESERKWLEDAGFEHLVKEYENGKEVQEELVNQETSSLTRTQAAAVKRRINSLNTTLRRRREQVHSSASATTSPDGDFPRSADFLGDARSWRRDGAGTNAYYGDAGSRPPSGNTAARPDVRRVFSPDGARAHPSLTNSSASFTYGVTSPSGEGGGGSSPSGSPAGGGVGNHAFRRGATLDSPFGGALPFLQNKSGHYAINHSGGRNCNNGNIEEGVKTISLTPTGTTPRCRAAAVASCGANRRNSPSAAEIFSTATAADTAVKPNSPLKSNGNNTESSTCCHRNDENLDHDSPERTPDAKLEFGYASPPTPGDAAFSPPAKDDFTPTKGNSEFLPSSRGDSPAKKFTTATTADRIEGVDAKNSSEIISNNQRPTAKICPPNALHQQPPPQQIAPPSQIPSQQQQQQQPPAPAQQHHPQKQQQQQQQPKQQHVLEDDLPNYVLVRDELGVTQINDLSAADLARIRSLSLIELTALFDVLDIQFNKRKPLKPRGLPKPGELPSSIFHVPLSWLLESDQRLSSPLIRVPLVFDRILSHLEASGLKEEGILRVPGAAARIKHIRTQLETNFYSKADDLKAIFDQVRTTDLAALSKQFLRELPQPLLTNEWVEAFASVERVPERKQQLQALNLLIILLPNVHRDSLKRLLMFLNKVVANQEFNKMTLTNVATIMAPNLFLQPKSRKHLRVKENEVNMAKGTTNVIKMLIKYHEILWTVPSFMVTQIRHQIEMEALKKSSRGDDGKLSCHNLHLMRWLGVKKRNSSTKTNASSSSGTSSSSGGTVTHQIHPPHHHHHHHGGTASSLSSSTAAILASSAQHAATSICQSRLLAPPLPPATPSGSSTTGSAAPPPPPISPSSSSTRLSHAPSLSSIATPSHASEMSARMPPSTDSLSAFDETEDIQSISSINEGCVSEGMICVRTGYPLAKIATQFQLDDRTTAGDLVQQFSRLHGYRESRIPPESLDPLLHPGSIRPCNSSSSSSSSSSTLNSNNLGFPLYNAAMNSSFSQIPPTRSTLLLLEDVTLLHLFEYGGNVGWRCLDPGTKMMALHRVNPSAKWVIQPRVAPFAVKR